MDNIVLCPHCNEPIIIEQINCGIFRHGFFIESNQQIEPHSTKTECDFYLQNNMIYGCSKPFKIIMYNNKIKAIKCEYI